MTARCFLCAARMWAPTERALAFPSGRRRRFRFACGSCGLLCDAPDASARGAAELRERLAGDVFAADEAASFGLDAYTLRTAATRARRGVEPTDAPQAEALRHPHGALAAQARLLPLAATPDAPAVALGILCREGDLDAVLDGVSAHAGWASGIAVMVDAAAAPARAQGAVRILARPLAGDFAAQRNALQETSDSPWMLQLDADESLDAATGALLPALARMADRDGAVSIGLPRRNLVDGVPSDVYPDVQYRLNRREVRFAGRVHERPERAWRRSFIALHGEIAHHLDRAHVAARSRRYEAMEPGRGRLEEAEALLRPYRD